jgi:hypothetical protein
VRSTLGRTGCRPSPRHRHRPSQRRHPRGNSVRSFHGW